MWGTFLKILMQQPDAAGGNFLEANQSTAMPIWGHLGLSRLTDQPWSSFIAHHPPLALESFPTLDKKQEPLPKIPIQDAKCHRKRAEMLESSWGALLRSEM